VISRVRRSLRDYGEALAKLPEDELLKNREATHESLKNIFHQHPLRTRRMADVTRRARRRPCHAEKDFDEVRTMEPLRGYLERSL